jgi:hypothetical protein
MKDPIVEGLSIRVTECRNCRRVLHERIGLNDAFDPNTRDSARRNYYGGWVCSLDCDRKACVEMEIEWGGSRKSKPNKLASEHIAFNWRLEE